MDPTKDINEYLKRLKNDGQCADAFFKATSGYIKFIAYKYLVDKSFVPDVVSSTMFKVFANISEFDENQNGKAWLYKIAQNEAYTINNRERKHSYVSLDEISEEAACITDDSQNLEFAEALENALSKLDERDREIVELRVFAGMTYLQIAKQLHMYVGTVYKIYKRSVTKILKEVL